MIDITDGVTFDGVHSYRDLGLILAKRPQVGYPAPRLSLVDVAGMDGVLDLTEFNSGRVCYGNRALVFTFAAMVAEADQPEFRRAITSWLHGRRIEQIILDGEPDWFYAGRCTVAFPEVYDWKLQCVVTVDADPFATAITATTREMRSSGQSEHVVDLMGVDRSSQPQHTDLRFGTASYPTCDLSIYEYLYIDKPASQSVAGAFAEIYDANGVSYTTAPLVFQNNRASIAVSTLSGNGIDVTKIYRIVVSWCGRCVALGKNTMTMLEIDVGDAPCVPEFDLSTYATEQNPVQVYVVAGGKTTLIPEGISSGEVVIPPSRGETQNVYMYTSEFSRVRHLYITYRGRKL